MQSKLARSLVAAAIAGAAFAGTAGTALADPVIVDQPDTSGLNDIYTFAPLGVPVIGLVQSLVKAVNGIIPN